MPRTSVLGSMAADDPGQAYDNGTAGQLRPQYQLRAQGGTASHCFCQAAKSRYCNGHRRMGTHRGQSKSRCRTPPVRA